MLEEIRRIMFVKDRRKSSGVSNGLLLHLRAGEWIAILELVNKRGSGWASSDEMIGRKRSRDRALQVYIHVGWLRLISRLGARGAC